MGVVEGSRRAPGARDQLDGSLALLRTLAPDAEPLLLPLALGFLREARGAGLPPRLMLEETLLTARRVRPRPAVGYALADRAVLARDDGEHPRGRVDLEEALSIFRRLDDTPGAAQVLGQLGNLWSVQGDHELARELHDESRTLREAAGDARGIGWCLNDLGLAAARAGDRARALSELESARTLFERTDDRPGLMATLVHLGYIAADDGRPVAARELLERALWSYTEVLDDALCAGWISIALAEIDVTLQDAGRARERLNAAVAHFRRAGEAFGESWCERLLGELPNAVLTND
jgi:tetratricopeptide (TPR) repeat protein